jgi:hypothetical protein
MSEPTGPETSPEDAGTELLRSVEDTYRAYRTATGAERERLLESYLAALRALTQFIMSKHPPG